MGRHAPPRERSDSRLSRFIAHPLVLMIIGFVLIAASAFAANLATRFVLQPKPNSPVGTLAALIAAVLVVFAYKGFKRWIERAPDREFARNGAVPELLAGLLLGLAIFSSATAAVAVFGGFEVLGIRGAGKIWSMLSLAIVSGVIEETLFRGILFRLIERAGGSILALVITSALFGAGHLGNDGASWFAGLAIAVGAGLLLGAAFMLTRRLWLAIGLHAGWNFTQGWIFSIPVSGGDPPIGLLITRRLGPDWLTGGEFGLEASAVTLVIATCAGIALLLWARRLGEIVPFKRASRIRSLAGNKRSSAV